MKKSALIYAALQDFAAAVTDKMTQVTVGEPEDQLCSPLENFVATVAAVLEWDVICTGETRLPDRLGRPDYAIHLDHLLAGFVELKAPGVGASVTRFSGRNRDQFKRFSAIPNILYTDGNEWALYRDGELVDKVVRLSGDVAADGKKAAGPHDAHEIERLLRDFLSWQPFIPTDHRGKIDLKRFAELLAPLCRMLRDDVTEALKDPKSPLVQLAEDWRQLLFPDAPNEQFADAYAQTVVFALLLGRSEGADPLTLGSAEVSLAAQHNLLSRALQVLTDPGARAEMTASLDLILRVIASVPPATLTGPEDPWLYFYEDFLAVYDPNLRKDAGAYYTPVEVVRCQVRLIDDLLVNRLHKPLGFADPSVITLDPAAGTGTYLLGIVEHALNRIEAEQGAGAVPGQATAMAANLYAFELMVGPYAVTELRVSRALRDRGGTLPADGTHVYLTDTLESPHAEPPKLPLFLRPIAEQHAKALKVKSSVPVIVCLGNPPYDRHDAVDLKDENNLSRYGGWVRFGDPLPGGTVKERKGKKTQLKSAKARLEQRQRLAILKDFSERAVGAGHGVDIKNLYNLYVYFWRWALWKVFEHRTDQGPGVVSFISASSYVEGDAFCGMREHMRHECDEVWILDLGGEGRGTRKSDNVFAIQTPVAIAIGLRAEKTNSEIPARVHYARLEGTRKTKLEALDTITDFAGVKWHDCPDDWQAPFRPAGTGKYFDWPMLTDLMPWQHSGCQLKRTWPICHDRETLGNRWRSLLESPDRATAFKETRDRKVSQSYSLGRDVRVDLPISKLPRNSPPPAMVRYGFRSFDRQWVLSDARVGDYFRPDLFLAHGDRQIYVASQLVLEIGKGPALTVSVDIPDLHFFAGRGGKDTIPLYRDAPAGKANLIPGVLELLGETYGRKLMPEDFLAYIYGVLAHTKFTTRFAKELETRELRVPITKDPALFEQCRAIGARLLWLHTFCERMVPKGKKRGHVPCGATKCTKAIPGDAARYPDGFEYIYATQTLHVGSGEFAPVSREVFEFEVSGLKVVQSWLRYRMKRGAGKKSSVLDEIRPTRWTGESTTELLNLLWVLEATIEGYPEQARQLEAVIASECFRFNEMPPVPEKMRKPLVTGGLFDEP